MRNFLARFGVVSMLVLITPAVAFAQASLFVTPATGSYASGESFNALINVDAGGREINAATADIEFDPIKLEVQSIGYSRSVFSIWTEKPTYSNSEGRIHFSGGLPSPGYNGSSGAVIRVTFKAKSAGTASVLLSNGSVLANDGKGTNVAENLTGATYTITGTVLSDTGAKTPSSTDTQSEQSQIDKEFAPTITDFPKQIQEGEVLYVRGLAFPASKVLLYLQKGNTEPLLRDVIAGADGKYYYQFNEGSKTGFYRIWARGTLSDGSLGDSSEAVLVEVVQPLFFRIGSVALSYSSIIVTLFALLFFGFFGIAWMWRTLRLWQIRRGKEVSQAEETLHEGFDSLKSGLDAYVGYLKKGKKGVDIKRREKKNRSEVSRGIEEIERRIEKEIEDIR